MELVNNMTEVLKNSMPSEELKNLIQKLQTVSTSHLKANEDFSKKENDLGRLEHQL